MSVLGWVQQTPAHQPLSSSVIPVESYLVFDAARNETLLFGGHNTHETWTWDGTDWTQHTPTHSPPSVGIGFPFGFGIAFDAAHSLVVYCIGADTWTWDGTDWTQHTPTHTPPEGAMSFHPASGKVVLYESAGGNTTWTWDGTDWTQVFPAHTPGTSYGPLVSDVVGGVLLLLRNFNGIGVSAQTTWTWDGTDWTQVFPAHTPGPASPSNQARFGFGMVGNTLGYRAVLYGGRGGPPVGNPGFLSDVWTWDGADWSRIFPGGSSPGAREVMGFALDSSGPVMTGGLGGARDTWKLKTLSTGLHVWHTF